MPVRTGSWEWPYIRGHGESGDGGAAGTGFASGGLGGDCGNRDLEPLMTLGVDGVADCGCWEGAGSTKTAADLDPGSRFRSRLGLFSESAGDALVPMNRLNAPAR